MGDSVFTSPTGYADSESGYSMESRSLAAYSGSSSALGRDSGAGFRYPYASEPVRHGYGRFGYVPGPQEADRPNPFNGPLSPDAENVVHMFLMNQSTSRGLLRPLESTTMTTPGRIADHPSPSAAPGPNGSPPEPEEGERGPHYSRTVIAQMRKDFLAGKQVKPPEPKPSSPERKTNKYLKPENRFTKPVVPQPGANGTHVVEDTVQSFQAPQIHHAEVVNLRQDSSSESEEDGSSEPPSHMILQSALAPMPSSVTRPPAKTPELIDEEFLRQQQELERKHREQQEQLRREHEMLMKKLQQHYTVDSSPVQSQPVAHLPQVKPPEIEQPQSFSSIPPQKHMTVEPEPLSLQPTAVSQPAGRSGDTPPTLPARSKGQVRQLKNNSGLSRSFEDPAYENFRAINEDQSSPPTSPSDHELGSPGKKKGFFSSLFKKQPNSSTKRGKVKGKRPRSEYVPEEDHYDEEISGVPKSQTDGDLKLHSLERSPKRLSPVVRQPGVYEKFEDDSTVLHKNESMITHPGMSIEQELGDESTMEEPIIEEPSPEIKHRKLSMSKPTNLDDIAKLMEQEEEEEERKRREKLVVPEVRPEMKKKSPPLPPRGPTAEEVFKNDPWFNSQPAGPIYENTVKINGPIYQNTSQVTNLNVSLDTTQEIDVDEYLGYSAEEDQQGEPVRKAIEEIVWPKSEPHVEAVDNLPEEKPASKKKPGIFSFKKKTPKQEPSNMEVLAAASYAEEVSPPEEKPKKNRSWMKKKTKSRNISTSEDEVVQDDVPVENGHDVEPEGEIVDILEALKDNVQQDEHQDDHKDDFQDESFDESRTKKPVKKGLAGIFQKPSWKSSGTSKKRSPNAKSQIGNQQPVDVSHLLDDDFGIEEPPKPKEQEEQPYTETDVSDLDQRGDHHETDDTSDDPQRKSKFIFGGKLSKKEKPEKEGEITPKAGAGKFFRTPSWKSPNKPKSSAQTDDAKPEVQELPEPQVTNEHLDDSYTEPAPVVTSSEEDRRESSIIDDVRYTSEEESRPAQVKMPVEMEEPEPTRPIKGRPKGKPKRGGSGLAGLFSSSRPASRGRSVPKREPDREEYDRPPGDRPEEEPQFRRRADSRGLGGLFTSKRSRSRDRKARPVSGPPAEPRHEEPHPDGDQVYDDQQHRQVPARRSRNKGFSNLFGSRRGPPAKSTGNLAQYPPEHIEDEENKDGQLDSERQSLSQSTASLTRQNRDKGLAFVFGSKSRLSGRKGMSKSTTFPVPDQRRRSEQRPESEPEHDEEAQEPRLLHQRQQDEVPSEPSVKGVDEERPPMPLPEEKNNKYSPTPKQEDVMVYDQVEKAPENTPPVNQASEPRRLPPADPNRQMGRRSGRFRKSTDASPGMSTGSGNSSLNESHRTAASPATPQSMMQNMFVEKVTKNSPGVTPQHRTGRRGSHEDSVAASNLGADFEYEKAMRNQPRHRPNQSNKRPSSSNVGRTESYRQARTGANFNSLPRNNGRQRQGQPQDGDDHDARSLGGERPRSRARRQEEQCRVM